MLRNEIHLNKVIALSLVLYTSDFENVFVVEGHCTAVG